LLKLKGCEASRAPITTLKRLFQLNYSALIERVEADLGARSNAPITAEHKVFMSLQRALKISIK
jgi:hypothetical protein